MDLPLDLLLNDILDGVRPNSCASSKPWPTGCLHCAHPRTTGRDAANAGGLQALQLAGLATSVVGIGVTVAGTALMLRRLNALGRAVGRIEAKLDDLPRK